MTNDVDELAENLRELAPPRSQPFPEIPHIFEVAAETLEVLDVSRREMHRRAQKAEGAIASAMFELDSWENTFRGNRENSVYANMVIRTIRKSLLRVSKAKPNQIPNINERGRE